MKTHYYYKKEDDLFLYCRITNNTETILRTTKCLYFVITYHPETENSTLLYHGSKELARNVSRGVKHGLTRINEKELSGRIKILNVSDYDIEMINKCLTTNGFVGRVYEDATGRMLSDARIKLIETVYLN